VEEGSRPSVLIYTTAALARPLTATYDAAFTWSPHLVSLLLLPQTLQLQATPEPPTRMPPKPRKKSAKAPAPLVDPDISDALAACKEAKIATRRLNEMTEGDPGVEEQTAKAAAAQWTLIEAGTNLATRQLLERPSLPEESREVQLGLLKLGDLLQQY
jgi:hypothetical protein